ncbi:MAG: DNA methyltransferase [Candidatus Poribacteria bacterium]
MGEKHPDEILEYCYQSAKNEVENDKGESFLLSLNDQQRDWLDIIIDKSESFKAILAVLTTSLIKKIVDTDQDVRYHKVELKNGYSGRTLDTKFITPFFKSKWTRLAMSESGWLTRSLEQPHPFTLNFPGKIKNKAVKESFLQILNDVEENKTNPDLYLIALFINLIKKQNISLHKSFHTNISEEATIKSIIEQLKLHFFSDYNVSGASRLPVIAIYSIYEILISEFSRYKGRKLKPLKSHLASDKSSRSIGDIEIIDKNNRYFEAIEIKHGKPIDAIMVRDAYEKFKNKPINRYYLLTTSEPDIESDQKENVCSEISKIKEEHGCEIIVNGIVPSLKYYLRLLSEPKKLIERYTYNLYAEFKKSTEIKEEHVTKWQEILGK